MVQENGQAPLTDSEGVGSYTVSCYTVVIKGLDYVEVPEYGNGNSLKAFKTIRNN